MTKVHTPRYGDVCVCPLNWLFTFRYTSILMVCLLYGPVYTGHAIANRGPQAQRVHQLDSQRPEGTMSSNMPCKFTKVVALLLYSHIACRH